MSIITGSVADIAGDIINGGKGAVNGAELDVAQQSYIANEEIQAGTDGIGANAIPLLGTDSLFNPFQIFRYSKFATGIESSKYNVKLHKLEYQEGSTMSSLFKSPTALNREHKESIENPSAIKIIDWANKKAETKSGPTYPYPYSLNDFLWCKWYGKIPNNRLLTLRRYPIPIEDNLQVHPDKLPLVPIAQAVSWFGEGTDNTLGNILNMSYGFRWKPIDAEVTDVTGNEIKMESLFEALGVTNKTAQQALKTAFSQSDSPFEFSGYDETLQKFTKENWESGAYWNRIKGPVNVINETLMRTRGMDYNHEIKLNFEYNLRSYGNLNPKVAFLDLLANMLSLTSNSASFWGGGYRYYKQTGVLLPGFNSDAMEKGDYFEGGKQVLSMIADMAQGGVSDIKKFIDQLNNSVDGDKSISDNASSLAGSVNDAVKNSKVGQNLIASRMASLHQKPLLMRALLDGRAVGEWHLMVGNPMDPIAVIGNLCLDKTSITFSEELGHDDFPMSVKFTISLKPGRSRAKQDILSMFNHGGGDLYHTPLQPPSSAMNTFGEYNTARIALANPSIPGSPEDAKKIKEFRSSFNSSATSTQQLAGDEAKAFASYFGKSVSGRYGSAFGKSAILVDYFTRLQTKD